MRIVTRNHPPEPTDETPYVQLDWLCERFIRRYRNPRTKKACRNAMQAYKNMLQRCNGYDERLTPDPRFVLSTHCDPFVLHNAAHYWREQKHAPLTIQSRLRCLHQIFTYASDEKLIPTKSFLLPDISDSKRATLQRAAYEDGELDFILRKLVPVVEHAKQIAIGYKPTGVGRDPRGRGLHSAKKKDPNAPTGWANWDNLVWYFENVMGSMAISAGVQNRDHHKFFFDACARYYGGVNKVYRRLGVTAKVDIRLIAPLAMKLSWETGLNTESLLGLKRDCLVESHPLTNLPFLRYYKARSTGEKDLHLGLLDTAESASLPLEYKQSMVIRRTIELILKITEPLVKISAEPDKSFLFLFQVRHKINDQVCRLDPKLFWKWSHIFLTHARKDNPEGNAPKVLNLGRFRPTRITHLARQGKDFVEIQAAVGHLSGSTTLRYLDSHQIAPKAKREVSQALIRIHENVDQFKQHPKPYATESTLHSEGVVYKGVLCDCTNIFDPPPSVRRLPTYQTNQACTYFNMCLLCPNALVVKQHLPRLITYQKEIHLALSNSIAGAPNTLHYEKALAVIEGILLDYSDEEVQWARDLAERSDYYLDPFTYHAVNQSDTDETPNH